MRHIGRTAYDSGYGYDDYDTRELISQCDAIVNRIRWEEKD